MVPPADVADIECNLPGVAQPTAPEHNFCLRVKSEHEQLKCVADAMPGSST